MAKNFIQPDALSPVAPTGGVLSGQAVQVGALFRIAAFDAIGGADVEVALEGTWELPKLLNRFPASVSRAAVRILFTAVPANCE